DNIGAIVAHGEHSTFGETKLFGSMKNQFTHWFSTKPFDKETGFVVYQQRYYDPILCKWLSRDLIGIKGSLNELGFIDNDGVNGVDYLLKSTTIYDKIFFAGHGVLHTEQRKDWKHGDSLLTRDIKRTKVVFSDGNKFWKDLLSGDKENVVTTTIIPLVCYDAYCDKDNELGINIIPGIGNAERNSIAWIAPFMDNLIEQFKTESCKTIEVIE
ncbi:MAG: hypothetical protein M0P27_02175, partial [Bacteroidales bacterium]|nr:hypothetical protein [Bacteroidales bacterium]